MLKHSSKKDLLHIATIGKTVGIRGEMKFHLKCDFPEQFVDGATFATNKKNEITLASVDLDKNLITIAGVNVVEDAKKYTNIQLFTTYEKTRESCHLDDGEFFWFDIVGCKIIENGQTLGVVKEVERFTVNDYLSIVTDELLVKSGSAKSFLLPYQPPFVVKTEIEKKVINVEGALDILEAS